MAQSVTTISGHERLSLRVKNGFRIIQLHHGSVEKWSKRVWILVLQCIRLQWDRRRVLSTDPDRLNRYWNWLYITVWYDLIDELEKKFWLKYLISVWLSLILSNPRLGKIIKTMLLMRPKRVLKNSMLNLTGWQPFGDKSYQKYFYSKCQKGSYRF